MKKIIFENVKATSGRKVERNDRFFSESVTLKHTIKGQSRGTYTIVFTNEGLSLDLLTAKKLKITIEVVD